ncbi:LysR family transcriptional regulator substrate-binding protein, partial [Cellulomonas septica]|uniref:LysR family transcriptional regulator substrate-binding protein n=1 Tax=Cellulomonas septica TaxID=285080 RepID=UPI001FE2D85B
MSPDEPATPEADDTGGGGRVFRVLVVPGVNPDRWLRVWRERLADVPLELVVVEPPDAEPALRAGDADVAILRLPVDRDALSAIPLYTEETVVVAARDHVFSVAEEVAPGDLADETVVCPDDDLVGWTDAPGEPFAGGPVATTRPPPTDTRTRDVDAAGNADGRVATQRTSPVAGSVRRIVRTPSAIAASTTSPSSSSSVASETTRPGVAARRSTSPRSEERRVG